MHVAMGGGGGAMALAVPLIISIGYLLVLVFTDAGGEIGIDYGTVADNLAPPDATLNVLKGCVFKTVRIYDTNPDILGAFSAAFPHDDGPSPTTPPSTSPAPSPSPSSPDGPVGLIVGTYNADVQPLANDPDFAAGWVASRILPFSSSASILGIIVGNEVIPGPLAEFVAGAMRNLRAALDSNDLRRIYVTTTIFGGSLANSYPPSATVFSPDSVDAMVQVVEFMNSVPPESRGPIFANVHPYFAYAGEPENIPQDYALFRRAAPAVQDGPLTYTNLFDAMFDSFVWAMEKIGGEGIEIAVGETGWPSAGNGELTTRELASEYNTNLHLHVTTGRGTPRSRRRRTGWPTLVLAFSLFNEDLKQPGVEQNWGLMYPDLTSVYRTPMCSSR